MQIRIKKLHALWLAGVAWTLCLNGCASSDTDALTPVKGVLDESASLGAQAFATVDQQGVFTIKELVLHPVLVYETTLVTYEVLGEKKTVESVQPRCILVHDAREYRGKDFAVFGPDGQRWSDEKARSQLVESTEIIFSGDGSELKQKDAAALAQNMPIVVPKICLGEVPVPLPPTIPNDGKVLPKVEPEQPKEPVRNPKNSA